jgi:carbon-monoxide dehydrogenase large subunit
MKNKQTVTKTGVGAWTTRPYDLEKAAGTLQYVDDLSFGENMLYARVVHSTVAHGEILEIDSSEAMKVPGVVKVIVGKDFNYCFGLYLMDRNPMAVTHARYIGDPVALVVAESEDAAEEGVHAVKVTYRELPAVLDPVKAAHDNTVLVHPNLGAYDKVDFLNPQPGTNIGNWFKIRRGDVDRAFKDAAVVVEEIVSCPQIAHGFLEPYCCVCHEDPASGNLSIWTSAQSAFAVRDILAKGLGYPLHKIRVVAPPIGGGFGGKAGMTIEALCLAAAMNADIKGRPVKLFIPREEVLTTCGVRQGYVSRIALAIDSDGLIQGIKNTFYFDSGISAEYGSNPVRSAGYTSTGCYYIPNVWTDSYAVYTNKPYGTAYRGFGLPELMGAMEVVVDIAAEKIGMDPVEFRLKNLLRPGLPTCTGMTMHGHALDKIIERAAASVKLNEKEPAKRNGWKRGKGMALAIKAPAIPADSSSSAIVKLLGDGTVEVLAATMDMGQGAYTAYSLMVSEELGIPLEKIRCIFPDTNSHPYDWQTVASRSCWIMGTAVKRAAIDAREKLLALYAEYWSVAAEDITIENGIVKCAKKNLAEPIDIKVQNGFHMPDGLLKGGPIIGSGSWTPPDIIYPDQETGQSPKSVVHFTVGAIALDIEMDPATGEIAVNKVSAGYDVGKAISPINVRGQIEGGTVQGLSAGLMEGMFYDDKGKLLTPDFTDYKIATTIETPDETDYFWEETPEEVSPYGNRGIGEHSMIAPAPALNNAVHNAVGVRIHSYPLNRERVYMASREAERGEKDFWGYELDRGKKYCEVRDEWSKKVR